MTDEEDERLAALWELSRLVDDYGDADGIPIDAEKTIRKACRIIDKGDPDQKGHAIGEAFGASWKNNQLNGRLAQLVHDEFSVDPALINELIDLKPKNPLDVQNHVFLNYSKGYPCKIIRNDLSKDGDINVVEFSLWVERDFESVCIIVDPQSWDESDHFRCAAVARPNWKNQYVFDCDDKSTRYKRKSPCPGSEWKGVLFEHFVFPFGPFTVSELVNFLNIKTTKEEERSFSFRYELRSSEYGRVYADCECGPVINVDEGCANVEVKDNGVVFNGRKRLRFKWDGYDSTLNCSAPLFLRGIAFATQRLLRRSE